MAELYKMINEDAHQRRAQIAAVIGNAVGPGNESYTNMELGHKAIEALAKENYEIIWLGNKNGQT